MVPERLQKYLSGRGVCSRRAAEDLIRAGEITVNGVVAKLGDKVTGEEVIVVQGKTVSGAAPSKIYIAFHKPKGVQTTLRYFPGQETLAQFDFGARVFPVGRLDKMSRGLILMTNDGDLANKLMHPRYKHEKVYHVRTSVSLSPEAISLMQKGIMIDGKKTAPCVVEPISDGYAITLREGRKRQIRRMIEAMGSRVSDLKRVSVGPIALGNLKAGRWRTLTEDEITALKRVTEGVAKGE